MEQVNTLVWTLKCDHLSRNPNDKKCLSVKTALELRVNMNILQTTSWLHLHPLCYLYFLSPLLQSPLGSLVLVWQRDKDLNVVEREKSRLAVEHSLVPVLVNLIGQGDDVALTEAQLSLVLWLKIVQRLTARLLRS